MKRNWVFALVALLFIGSALAGDLVSAHETKKVYSKQLPIDQIRMRMVEMYGTAATSSNYYVGSRLCMACHEEDAATFYDTQHSFALIRPMTQYTLVKKKGVLANSLGQKVDDFMAGLDFNAVSSALDPYKPNAPILSVKKGVYTVTINDVDLPVLWVRQQYDREGNWIQRYGVKIPVNDQAGGKAGAAYLAGIQYESHGNKWVLDGIEDVYEGNIPKIKKNMTTAEAMQGGLESFDQNCVGCHVSGIRSLGKNEKGEVVFKGYTSVLNDPDDPNIVDYDGDGSFETVNIGCESCHGPGAQHILGTTAAQRQARIVNPANLPQAEQLALCGQCHSRVKSVPGKLYSWPYKENLGQQWIPGTGSMDSFYTENFSVYPDGWNGRGTHSQWNEAIKKGTLHFNNQYEKMNCWTCHTLHRNVATSQTRNSLSVMEGNNTLRITASYRDNTLCLACHAGFGPFAGLTKTMISKYKDNLRTIAEVTEKHTHHPYGPDRELGLSRCTGCHMPYKGTIPGTSDYYVAGHTWDAMSPAKSLNPAYLAKGGQPSSCAVQCHMTRAEAFGLGIKARPASNQWTSEFDKAMATILVKFFGPQGAWWKTTAAATQ
jgi:hypothetical protein